MVAKKKVLSPTAAGVNPLEAQVTNHPPKLSAEELATFDFAVNVVKLNRSKAWVNQQAALAGKEAPKGKELVEAVKERYIALGGLLVGEKLAGKSPSPRSKKNVVNLADEDAD